MRGQAERAVEKASGGSCGGIGVDSESDAAPPSPTVAKGKGRTAEGRRYEEHGPSGPRKQLRRKQPRPRKSKSPVQLPVRDPNTTSSVCSSRDQFVAHLLCSALHNMAPNRVMVRALSFLPSCPYSLRCATHRHCSRADDDAAFPNEICTSCT
jgi:hypothetical protein